MVGFGNTTHVDSEIHVGAWCVESAGNIQVPKLIN